jgi:TM2 domain-containing membrane protein YozV
MLLLEKLTPLFSQPKSRKISILLALVGTILPIAGVHKFYLGQPLWGGVYFLFDLVKWTSPIPHIACAIEAVWYLAQDQEQFNGRFNRELGVGLSSTGINRIDPTQVGAIADALRQLDQLRADGLMSEYEFEQKRRQLLDRIA